MLLSLLSLDDIYFLLEYSQHLKRQLQLRRAINGLDARLLNASNFYLTFEQKVHFLLPNHIIHCSVLLIKYYKESILVPVGINFLKTFPVEQI